MPSPQDNASAMSDFNTPAQRWSAVTTRNPQAANAFIYSVLTTRIYCRPTCPSRLARRANIVFHDDAAQAEAEGFRACMRCKPGMLKGEDGDTQKLAVEKAKELLRSERQDSRWTVKSLAKQVGMTESHFCRVFKKVEGSTVGDFRAVLQNDERISEQASLEVPEAMIYGKHGASHAGFGPEMHTTVQETSLDLDTANLDQDWQEFIGHPYQATLINQSQNGELALFEFDLNFGIMGGELTPETLSDQSLPNLSDDGFQFLNFDDANTLSY